MDGNNNEHEVQSIVNKPAEEPSKADDFREKARASHKAGGRPIEFQLILKEQPAAQSAEDADLPF